MHELQNGIRIEGRITNLQDRSIVVEMDAPYQGFQNQLFMSGMSAQYSKSFKERRDEVAVELLTETYELLSAVEEHFFELAHGYVRLKKFEDALNRSESMETAKRILRKSEDTMYDELKVKVSYDDRKQLNEMLKEYVLKGKYPFKKPVL